MSTTSSDGTEVALIHLWAATDGLPPGHGTTARLTPATTYAGAVAKLATMRTTSPANEPAMYTAAPAWDIPDGEETYWYALDLIVNTPWTHITPTTDLTDHHTTATGQAITALQAARLEGDHPGGSPEPLTIQRSTITWRWASVPVGDHPDHIGPDYTDLTAATVTDWDTAIANHLDLVTAIGGPIWDTDHTPHPHRPRRGPTDVITVWRHLTAEATTTWVTADDDLDPTTLINHLTQAIQTLPSQRK